MTDALCQACRHPVDHHDAGECWTGEEGQEVWDDTACDCSWLVLPGDDTGVGVS